MMNSWDGQSIAGAVVVVARVWLGLRDGEGIARSGHGCRRFNARFSVPSSFPLLPLHCIHSTYIFFLPPESSGIQLRLTTQILYPFSKSYPHPPLTFIQDSINMLSSVKNSG